MLLYSKSFNQSRFVFWQGAPFVFQIQKTVLRQNIFWCEQLLSFIVFLMLLYYELLSHIKLGSQKLNNDPIDSVSGWRRLSKSSAFFGVSAELINL
jgi:hypothetical protein